MVAWHSKSVQITTLPHNDRDDRGCTLGMTDASSLAFRFRKKPEKSEENTEPEAKNKGRNERKSFG